MPVECKALANLCDYPVAMDTYEGCEHACKYCMVKQTKSIARVTPVNCEAALRRFIEGKRDKKSAFIDWNIPIKLGTRSDPFQPCELERGETLKVLRIFAETKYPFIIITKNPCMLMNGEYLDLIQQCRCVLTISMLCPALDVLEPYAAKYEKRLEAIRFLSDKVTRIIVRCSLYFPDKYKDALAEIPRWADAGAYGAVLGAFGTSKKTKGLTYQGGVYMPPIETLAPMYKSIRNELHKNGMQFYCGDAPLKFLGDSLTCCGTEGLEDFKPCTYNWCHLAHGGAVATPAMEEPGTSYALFARKRTQEWYYKCKELSFVDMMHEIEEGRYIEWYRSLRREWGE